MAQLVALAWLKWAIFRNSMRSKKAVAGSVATTFGMLLALAASLLVALTLGTGAYFFAYGTRGVGGREFQDSAGYLLLLFMFTLVFMMWALTPLALGGGNRFSP